jgi:hypothetical protein
MRIFRFRWDRIDATLIDRRFLERGDYNVNRPGSYQVWEYIVEFTDERGQAKRLPIKEKTFKINLPEIGGTVPILVNKKRSKAAFDLKDPRIDAVGALERKQKAEKARDEARFREKLGEPPD